MNGKRVTAVLLFLVAGFILLTTKSHVWGDYPLWVSLVVLFLAFLIGGVALDIWRSAKSYKN
jgi:hypothetical protein